MKTYTLFLDILILFLLVLAVNFQLTDNYLIGAISGHRSASHSMIISWQTLFFLASFCVFLRFIARKFA